MMGEADFLHALLRTASFWQQVAPALLGAVLLLLGCCWPLRQARHWRRLRRARRGSANAVELVLVAPLFMLLALLGVQMGFFANDSLIVHYAAYSAARSARVHDCRVQDGPALLRNIGSLDGLIGQINAAQDITCSQDAARYAERAARLALVAAAPAMARNRCDAGCELPQGYSRALLAGGRQPQLGPALAAKLRYAFTPANAAIRSGVIPPDFLGAANAAWDFLSGLKVLPAFGEVRYRHDVLAPLGPLLRGLGIAEARGDGSYFITGHARMWLL